MHPFLYPLKTLENLTVFCFQGVEKGFMGNKWVNGGKEKFLVALFWRWCGEFDDLNADEDDILGLFLEATIENWLTRILFWHV